MDGWRTTGFMDQWRNNGMLERVNRTVGWMGLGAGGEGDNRG